jgi:hypothetical protein
MTRGFEYVSLLMVEASHRWMVSGRWMKPAVLLAKHTAGHYEVITKSYT